ncbi:hypothetical protein CLOM_g24128 [Closterium sp. NIES-68]|nr:hypothetical protein CLOM_g24128 [Closterium sp. NIES-68]
MYSDNFRLSQPELEELQQQLDYLLTKGFIRPSTSPYAAPHTVHTEKRWRIPNVHRLPRTEPHHHQVPLPDPASRRPTRPTSRSQVLLENRSARRLPPKFASPPRIATRPPSEPATAVTNTCCIRPAQNRPHVLARTSHLRSQPSIRSRHRRQRHRHRCSSITGFRRRVTTSRLRITEAARRGEELYSARQGDAGDRPRVQDLARNYYWPNMADDVRKYVSSCTICQIMKSSHQRAAGLLQPLDPPERPWQHVTMDYVTGLPADPSGNDAILVVVDRLTKMAHFIACQQTITAEQTAQLFIANVIRLHGLPSAIISDRDPKFTSNFWRPPVGPVRPPNSNFHPPTTHKPTGQTERVNQTMEQLIRSTCTDPSTWEKSLPLLEFAYNNATSATTNHSPFFLNYGQDPVVPSTPNIESPVPWSQKFAEDILATREKAAEAIRKANLVASRQADRHRRDANYKVSDLVLLDTRNLRLPIPSKLRPRFYGPFQVTNLVTPVTVHLRLPADWRHHPAFHVSLLRPYVPSSSDLARNRGIRLVMDCLALTCLPLESVDRRPHHRHHHPFHHMAA